MKKVLILGKGQLGTVLEKELKQKYDITIYPHRIGNMFDYQDDNFNDFFDKNEFDVIINNIAISDTRKCQENWNDTYNINARFPVKLATYIMDNFGNDTKLIHISTGCIFDGNGKPHYEDSTPTPLISYSRQKLVAEACSDIHWNTVIIRPRMIFSDINTKSNILYKIQGFHQLLDEQNSMTCAYDISNFIEICIEEDLQGTFNFCNKGMISPFSIKRMIDEVYSAGSYSLWKINKRDLHDKIKLALTDTWIDSKYLSKYYSMPNIEDRIKEMIKKSPWLKVKKIRVNLTVEQQIEDLAVYAS